MARHAASVRTFQMFVNGAFVDASDGELYPIPNPATEEIEAYAPNAAPADMGNAISAARRAFDEGPWRKVTRYERARILRRIADGIARRKEEFRSLLVRCAGATYATHAIQLDMPIEFLYQYADWALRFDPVEMLPPVIDSPVAPGVNNAMVYHQPVGVCGLIPTWNFPLYLTVQKLGPALAAGCTMVFKPSPFAPVVDLLLAEVVAECDLPPGVYNVVTGQLKELGSILVEHPAVDKISFTGSAQVGKTIMGLAAGTLKRVHLELGGKSAAIILDEPSLEAYAIAAAAPSFFHAGQGCALCTRLLVPKRLQDAAVEKIRSFLETGVRIGDPADPSVLLGPVIREERRRAIEGVIASGRSDGALLVTGGGRPLDLPRGYFLEPTVFCNVRNTMRIAMEEIFGPVLCILSFQDEAEAIEIANQSPYGLSGAIYCSDTARAIELAKRIRTGSVHINGAANLLHAPFGGFKQSGLGREGGRWGLLEYYEVQAIAWR